MSSCLGRFLSGQEHRSLLQMIRFSFQEPAWGLTTSSPRDQMPSFDFPKNWASIVAYMQANTNTHTSFLKTHKGIKPNT